jgi:hypothetical protein
MVGDDHGRVYQFVQQDDYFALRSKDEGSDEWIYSGTWMAGSDRYGPTHTHRGSQAGDGE